MLAALSTDNSSSTETQSWDLDLATLDTTDPKELDRLGDAIATLAAHQAILEQRQLTFLRVFDAKGGWDGFLSCAVWLTYRTGCNARTARQKVQTARALGHLPQVDQAFAEGKLSYTKVRAIARVCEEEVTEKQEANLLSLAREATGRQLEVLLQPIRRDQKLEAKAAFEREERRQVFSRELESGLVRVVSDLLPEEARLVIKSVETAIEEAYRAPKACVSESGSAEPPHRTRFGRADGLVAMANAFLTHQGTRPAQVPGRYEILVHVNHDVTDGELDDGRPILGETARRLSCDAPRVVVTHRADSTVETQDPACATGGSERLPKSSVVDVGRRTRAISAGLRRALLWRDRGCRFPGCTTTLFVEAHHVEHWADGGETKLENLVLLCGRHHKYVHERGYTVRMLEDGTPCFIDRSGYELPNVAQLPQVTPAESKAVLAELYRKGVSEQSLRALDGSQIPDLGYATSVVATCFFDARECG